jgi:hypothetical protein
MFIFTGGNYVDYHTDGVLCMLVPITKSRYERGSNSQL